MKTNHLLLLLVCAILWSCQAYNTNKEQPVATPDFQNKGHELVYKMAQKVGDYQKMWAKQDVVYTYTYVTPDQKTDRSTEKYIFAGELSYGAYHTHERTLPELEGMIEQGYDGNAFWLKHEGENVQDDEKLKRVIFNRKTNFYWFTMMQKLLDPGLMYEHLKQENINGSQYDVVKISFATENGKPTDTYQLYINQKTDLVDQFLFTVVDFNVVETPFLMKMEYEEVEGLLIPTKRKYTQANWDGKPLNENWINVSWTDIKFNNGLSRSTFMGK